jgi:23S rRNA (uracil1939-C5)-methyltransferase
VKNREKIIWENVAVEDYAAEGKAIGKVDGKVVFIENCVPGDVVTVQVLKNKKDWAEAFPIQFIAYSPDRVKPFCAHFGICGGCAWQNLPYEKQLQYKQKQVQDQLQRIGKLALPELQPIVGCDETTGYRNKIEYTFATREFIPKEEFEKIKQLSETTGMLTQQGVAGFHAKGFFNKIVDIDVCHLQKEPSNEIRKFIAQFAKLRKISFYDMATHTGWLRNVQVRNTLAGEWMINVILGYEDKENREALLNLLLENFPQITTLLYTINEKLNDTIYDLTPQIFFAKQSQIARLHIAQDRKSVV